MSSPSAAARPSDSPLTVPRDTFSLHAWPAARRGIALAACLVALADLAFFVGWLLVDILEGAQRLTPAPLAAGLAVGCVLPLALVAGLRRASRATLEVDDAGLTLVLRDGARVEVPFDAVEAVRPWRLPLPRPGLALRLKSGRALDLGLEAEDALPVLEALERRQPALGAAARHPLVRYGHARHALWRKRWYHLGFKFVLFPLLPTSIFFRAHQYISFGGAFGEYQAAGLGAYLRTFGRYYAPVAMCLLLVACFWRPLTEGASLLAAWLWPSRARGVRRGAEWLGRLVYYAGILAFTAWRFLA
ncbi:hypothetical protein LZ198_26630 [Myxococcus sp. K15C18031901]|uniref:hypothetical protein n=1 Tax=Myxococcus dinghuensis TaxID=2906761 RepID=UPI0020A754DE|nr:hypothetical protein [Myxococcus dinghuensis]MCP3102454.1 hypothetical protein [Myxococcus dinghuensis]